MRVQYSLSEQELKDAVQDYLNARIPHPETVISIDITFQVVKGDDQRPGERTVITAKAETLEAR